jgi:hypothetical protein
MLLNWDDVECGRVVSDLRVMGDQGDVFGQVASVPTAWRTLKEAAGGDRTRRKVTTAINKARHYAWSQVIARHGQLPPVPVADRQLTGITCIRLDATVVPAHPDKEQAQPNFKGFGHPTSACMAAKRTSAVPPGLSIGP